MESEPARQFLWNWTRFSWIYTLYNFFGITFFWLRVESWRKPIYLGPHRRAPQLGNQARPYEHARATQYLKIEGVGLNLVSGNPRKGCGVEVRKDLNQFMSLEGFDSGQKVSKGAVGGIQGLSWPQRVHPRRI